MVCRSIATFRAISLILGCLVVPVSLLPVEAAILTYPGSPPCNSTLQACIDGAGTGDTVEIGTNEAIEEHLDMTRSIVLKAAAGFKPVIGGQTGGIIRFRGPDGADNFFTFQGITVRDGNIDITHGSIGTLTVIVSDNDFLVFTGTQQSGISVSDYCYNNTSARCGDLLFLVSNNRMTVPSSADQTEGISVSSTGSGHATGVIQNNDITMRGNHQGAAIDVYNGGTILSVDVSGNTVSGTNYNGGIVLFQTSAAASTTARITNNLVTGQNGNVGNSGAIAVYGSSGELDVAVMNNTVAGNNDGISVDGRHDLGAVVRARVTNNIIVNSTREGLSLDSDFVRTIDNRYNLVFGNKFDAYVPGLGTVTSDPLFVGNGNYRLRPDSPAVNKGLNTPVDGLPSTDLDGLSRIFGGTVDIGAYEYAVMTAPENQQYHTYAASASPVRSPAPAHARPLGIGSFAAGGSDIRLSVDVGPLSNPVDVYIAAAYLGIAAPPQPDIFILKPDNTFQNSSVGVVPWKTGITEAVEALTGNIPITSLPSGFYRFYVAVTPVDSTSTYYIWETGFFIPFFIIIQ
ncbi:MAG TPA: choice-of-anchor Q domain-containing protein [Dissulfurispiraceae bacterium]|nr:choice-of-anchor Q domain-containing protein [Dissulfurispiraceae bacterium]